MSESEALGIGFEIDHYRGQKKTGQIQRKTQYMNLMYACQRCNRLKKAYPWRIEEVSLTRIIKIDVDNEADHIEESHDSLIGKTKIGKYTIDACALNRADAKELRRSRRELSEARKRAIQAMKILRSLSIDEVTRKFRVDLPIVKKDAQILMQRFEDELRSLTRAELKSLIRDAIDTEDPAFNRSRALRMKRYQSLDFQTDEKAIRKAERRTRKKRKTKKPRG